jgi:hypothetical protein
VVGVRGGGTAARPTPVLLTLWRSRGQGSQLGGLKNVGSYPGSGSRRDQRCLSCKRRIAWGERCESCKRELAARHRRKPR